MTKELKTSDMKQYRNNYYINNKDKFYNSIKNYRENNKIYCDINKAISDLHTGKRRKLTLKMQEKYQIYYDNINNKYKSHIFEIDKVKEKHIKNINTELKQIADFFWKHDKLLKLIPNITYNIQDYKQLDETTEEYINAKQQFDNIIQDNLSNLLFNHLNF